jgi:hypothetical protein
MAFITKKGDRYQVRHGRSGYLLSSHPSRAEAVKRRDSLHREFKPRRRNRGRSARRRWRMSMRLG